MKTRLANFFARFSVDRWNSSRPLRKLCRLSYQALGWFYVLFHPSHPERPYLSNYAMRPSHNTYPWPYRDQRFADWPECADTGAYTLISDPSGFVIRHCTSYCAWKLRELTGRWPKARFHPDAVYHAKDWQLFLSENGFNRVNASPYVNPEKHYIGIDAGAGEYGQLYWYEGFVKSRAEISGGHTHYHPAIISCTTYRDHQFAGASFSIDQSKRLIWVRID